MAEKRKSKECPDCHSQIDARATICPHCGKTFEERYQEQKREEVTCLRKIGSLIAAMIFLVGLWVTMSAVIDFLFPGESGEEDVEPVAEVAAAAPEGSGIEPTLAATAEAPSMPTSAPTPVPSATPTVGPPMAPAYREFVANHDSMTDAQWEVFAKNVVGTHIDHWTGRVSEVDVGEIFGGYTVYVDMDGALFRTVYLDVDESVALALNKNQEITFSGTIKSVGDFLGLSIRVKDVTIHN